MLNREYPELAEAWTRFASVPIRNAGTLGGNVANGSPIGDSMPVLIALGASIVLRRGDAERELPLEDFYIDYQETALGPGEFVDHIRVPRAAGCRHPRLQGVQAIRPGHLGGVRVFRLLREHGQVKDVRIGCGGVAPSPSGPRNASKPLPEDHGAKRRSQRRKRRWTKTLRRFRTCAPRLYRRLALGNLLHRFYLETRAATASTRVIDYVTP
jgi:xanthine dehydrogenase small subunit